MSLREHYCDCRFIGAQLYGKRVEFRFVLDGDGYEGNGGKFIVSGNAEGKLWIRIETPVFPHAWQHPHEARNLLLSLPCSLVRQIEVHPEAQEKPQGPQFLLWAPSGNHLSTE